MNVTKAALAIHLDCTVETISDYRALGVVAQEPDGKYDETKCRRSVLRHLRDKAGGRRPTKPGGLDLSDERAKLAREQSEGISIKNALARGDLVPTGAVERFMTNDYALVAERMQAIPGKLADSLSSPEHPRHEIEEALRWEINEALNELHDPASFSTLDPDPGAGDGEAGAQTSAKAQPDRVGEPVPARRGEDDSNPGQVAN